jgi:hypothetical protein
MTDYLPAHGRIIFVESDGFDPFPAIRGPLATFADVYAAINACSPAWSHVTGASNHPAQPKP